MRHPFDGLNLPAVTRRGALGQMAGATAALLGLGTALEAQQVEVTTQALGEEGGPAITTLAVGEEGGPTTKALGEEGAGRAAVTTEPFGEEAGKVMSRAVPGLEDGKRPAPTAKAGEAGGPTTKAVGEEGGNVLTEAVNEAGGPTTKALGEEGAVTRARGEDGGPVVPVQPSTTDLSDKHLEAAWADMADRDAAKGVQGCAILYGAKRAVPFLKEKLAPANVSFPEVDEKQVAKLVAGLDADEFDVREKAEAELAKLGPAAVPALEKAAKEAKSAEQRTRIARLVAKSKEMPKLAQARRGLEVLVALRLPEARDLLAALAKGDEKEWLTQEAKKALDRASK
jgi:hypothetical protein